MKNSFRHFYFTHIDPRRIVSRINDGKRDLNSAIARGTPILEDQRNVILDFWKPYTRTFIEKKSFDIRWFDVYNKTNLFGNDLKLYIPDGYYYSVIDTFFNDPLRCKYMDDKNLYDLYFHDVNQAKMICRKEKGLFLDGEYRVITMQDAVNLCSKCGQVIIKPSVESWAGAGIKKWNAENDNISVLVDALSTPGSFVIQEIIKQHSCLSQFNATCVNTMRLVTLFFEGEVHVVTAVAIMGGKGAFTNHLHRGGLICGIHSDGSLFHTAFDGNLNMYKQHPNGPIFSDCKILNFNKCVDLVKSLSPRLFGMSKLTAWDITIDETGEPLLIEANFEYGGIVQKAGGPIFGEMTESILKTVHKGKV
ncbi:MAG: hypothetical protein MJZ67_00135 [Bacteroidales bacterium]|nr:hypothetical protein [Bacteroidales bacterium]